MSSFFLALAACALATLAGRTQVHVARLSAALGPRAWLVIAAWTGAALSSALAGLLASQVGEWTHSVHSHGTGQLIAAACLLLAAAETGLRRSVPAPREPTLSAGAALLAMLASQLADGARLLLFALVLLTAEAEAAAAGGAAGSILALGAAIRAGSGWDRLPHRRLAAFIATALVAAALVIGLPASGLAD